MISNVGLKPTSTTTPNDTLRATSSNWTPLGSGFKNLLDLPHPTNWGQLLETEFERDVDVLLTGAHWGLNGGGDRSRVMLRIGVIRDREKAAPALAILFGEGKRKVSSSNCFSNPFDINSETRILTSRDIDSGSWPCTEIGFLLANFTDAGEIWEILGDEVYSDQPYDISLAHAYWDNGRFGIGTNNPLNSFDLRGDDEMFTISAKTLGGAGGLGINKWGSGDRFSYADFYSSGLPGAIDHSSRIIRNPGVDGTFQIVNTGEGAIQIGSNSSMKPIQLILGGNTFDLPCTLSRGTSIGVINTTTETQIFSYTIPAGIMRTARSIRFVLMGSYTNNSGANRTFILRFKFNGTTFWQDTSAAIATSASGRVFYAPFIFANQGAANNNRFKGRFALSTPGAVTTGSSGDLAVASPAIDNVIDTGNAPNVDTAAAVTVSATIQHSNADTSWFQDPVCVELV